MVNDEEKWSKSMIRQWLQDTKNSCGMIIADVDQHHYFSSNSGVEEWPIFGLLQHIMETVTKKKKTDNGWCVWVFSGGTE